MCGICGIYDLTHHQRTDFEMVRRMCGAIRHRGPDGDNFYTTPDVALGTCRLSIIDIAGSDQPLYNEDRSVVLVFNGEIYNYRELRTDLHKRGHVLHTNGDGETIVHLYEECGLDLFAYLRGMYAIALWDANRELLVLAADHIGMKPLYLHEQDGLLRFASEVKALYTDPSIARDLNLNVLDTYLSFGYMIGEDTLFAGVRRLPPGHVLVAENGATRLVEYWRFGQGYIPHRANHHGLHNLVRNGAGIVETVDEVTDHWHERRPPSETAAVMSEETLLAHTRTLLEESVRLHLRSDVPLGLFLSGGVDSASVLALMSNDAEGRVKTFTVGYDATVPDNELIHARRIAAHFKTDHHERVITAHDWWRGFEQYVYHHDEPNANSSAVSLLLLSEATAPHVRVVLTGLGGDELFGGYAHHYIIPWLLGMTATRGSRGIALLLQRILGALEAYYPVLKRYRIIGALPTYLPRYRHALLPRDEALRRSLSFDGFVFSDALRRRLYSRVLKAAWIDMHHKEIAFAHVVARSLRDSPQDMAQALVINTWLAGNALLNCDKVTMAHSLEARVPFFDPILLSFAAAVPPKIRMKRNKYVLREAMRPYLPDFALERPKQPFSTPILGWFSGELSGRIQDILLDQGAFIRDLFDRSALEHLLRAHFDGRASQVEVIFRLLTLELWARQFLRHHRVAPPLQKMADS
jgi:asparagine synthase (glutamine-hydrolysing)